MTRFYVLMVIAAALAALWLGGCDQKRPASAPTSTSDSSPQRLTVLAAASLADAFREIGRAFEAAHPGVRVEFSFAGSNQLRTQLEHGAPGDVFASADRRQMDAAAASKVVDPATARVFAHNRLVVIIPRENRAGVSKLSDLSRPGLKIVVADQAVPAGNYTRLMLERAGESAEFGAAFVKGFEANIVSREENVSAVVAKIALNQADAGVAYASDAAGSNGARLTVLALPVALEQRADYLVAVASRAADPKLAVRFVEFLASKDASATLVNRGFAAPAFVEAGVPGSGGASP